MRRIIFIVATIQLLISCLPQSNKTKGGTTKKPNQSATFSTDTSKLSQLIDLTIYKPVQTKFQYLFIDNSGQNGRISVPGPSDYTLQAILYFDTTTFDLLKSRYSDSIYLPMDKASQEFNFDWLDTNIKLELLESDSSYKSYPDHTFGKSVNGKILLMNNKVLLKKSTS